MLGNARWCVRYNTLSTKVSIMPLGTLLLFRRRHRTDVHNAIFAPQYRAGITAFIIVQLATNVPTSPLFMRNMQVTDGGETYTLYE